MNRAEVMKREPRDGSKGWTAKLGRVTFSNTTGLLTRAVRWCVARQKARSASRLLHVEETVSLGQKRFAAVIRVENARYLVGGGANDVVLLAALGQEDAKEAECTNPQSAQTCSSPSNQEEARAFQAVLEQVSTPRKPRSVKAPPKRSKDGTKQCA